MVGQSICLYSYHNLLVAYAAVKAGDTEHCLPAAVPIAGCEALGIALIVYAH